MGLRLTGHQRLEAVLTRHSKQMESGTEGQVEHLVFRNLKEILMPYLHQGVTRALQITLTVCSEE